MRIIIGRNNCMQLVQQNLLIDFKQTNKQSFFFHLQ